MDAGTVLEKLRKARPEVAFLTVTGPERLKLLEAYRALQPPYEIAGVEVGILDFWNAGLEGAGIWPALWYHEFRRYSGRELNSRFRKFLGRPAESQAWANYTAVKILWEAILKSGTLKPEALIRYLEGEAGFDAHKGRPLSFRPWDHQLRQPLLIVRARPPERVKDRWGIFRWIGEVPLRGTPGKTDAEILDTLGLSRLESRCRFRTL